SFAGSEVGGRKSEVGGWFREWGWVQFGLWTLFRGLVVLDAECMLGRFINPIAPSIYRGVRFCFSGIGVGCGLDCGRHLRGRKSEVGSRRSGVGFGNVGWVRGGLWTLF
ncbi:MAG: hypothetical protein JJU02_16160, partial [Cryomorphaceae bacterium]|nr:hypothetical protein [Cryomorphaceae bacterium]